MLCASPRRGNSLEAARIFCGAFSRAARAEDELALNDQEGGMSLTGGSQDHKGIEDKFADIAVVDMLNAYRVEPCVSCGVCGQAGMKCPQADKDDSEALFARLTGAKVFGLVSPVYFYHVPALLKALIDRCQFYYRAFERGEADLKKLPQRKAFIILLGAREQGERLFEGSLMTLKLALKPLNFELSEPLLLRGLDGPRDLSGRDDLRARIAAYGTEAAGALAVRS